MEVFERVDFLLSDVMVIELIPKHWVLFQVASKALVMSSLYTCTDVQNKSVELVCIIRSSYFGEDVLEVNAKLKVQGLVYLRTSILVILENAQCRNEVLRNLQRRRYYK